MIKPRNRLKDLRGRFADLNNTLNQMSSTITDEDIRYFQQGNAVGDGMMALMYTLPRIISAIDEEIKRNAKSGKPTS